MKSRNDKIQKEEENNRKETNYEIIGINGQNKIYKGKKESSLKLSLNKNNYNKSVKKIDNSTIDNNSKNKKIRAKRKRKKKVKNNIKIEKSNDILNDKEFDNSKKDLNENENYFNSYNEEEINSLDYEEAKIRDKRSYFQFYLSLLKTKHILIFTFCLISDYNSQIMKIYIFFYNFMINYTVSAMFYSDDTMHKIYIDKGSFDYTYQLPQMFYSFIISIILTNLLNYLGLYEEDIIIIKNNKKTNDNNKRLFIIKCKVYLFFIITYILLLFIWFYLGCFCAVYKNTQIHLLKEVCSSFVLSFINPLFVCLLPGLFRIPSLKSNSNKICLYKFSKLIEILF